MTAIWILSDLHQECKENAFDPQVSAPAHADVVVCAGDVDIPLARSIDWLADRMSGVPVVLVPGNHEYWRGEMDRYSYQDVVAAGRDRAAARGVHLLVDGDSVVIDDVRFVGGTLWSDFGLRDPIGTLADAIGEAKRRMNDYHRIRYGGNRSKNKLDPRDTIYLHRQTRARIEDALAQPHDGPTVVVTHHAPHPECLPEPGFDLACCYASDLETTVMYGRPDLWVHGHIHGRVDFDFRGCRFLANARGHVEEPSCKVFDPAFVVEVGQMALTPGM